MSPMSPRLLRPRQTTHPEAANWASRVVANGGSVSGTTLSTVSNFCKAIDAAGIRDRFYRLSLMCGTGLNACLVPLYRGPSLGGTQYGNTTDTNVGPFVSGDYAENSGLTAQNGTTKYLNTGLATSALSASVYESMHLSAWHGSIAANITDPYFVGYMNGATDRGTLQTSIRTSSLAYESARIGKTTQVISPNGVQGARPPTFLLGQRSSATSLALYRNGLLDATNAASTTGIASSTLPFFVFAYNSSGTRVGDQPGTTLRHYSIGDDMTDAQVLAFYNALAAFNTAMNRTS